MNPFPRKSEGDQGRSVTTITGGAALHNRREIPTRSACSVESGFQELPGALPRIAVLDDCTACCQDLSSHSQDIRYYVVMYAVVSSPNRKPVGAVLVPCGFSASLPRPEGRSSIGLMTRTQSGCGARKPLRWLPSWRSKSG